MKKILVLATTPFLNDGLTKIEFDVYQYCRKQMCFSFATSFINENEFLVRLKNDGVTVFYLKKKKNVLAYMKSIRKLIHENDFDAVYIHGNSAMMLIEALPCKIGGAKRIITHCHNTKTKYGIFHYIFKPIFNCIVDEKLACSELAAKWAYSGNNYHVVLNGIETEKFKFNIDIRNKIRKELNWEENLVIGHIGRFNFQKNHEFLIDVFAEVHKLYTNARLLLIGEGELETHIRQKVKSLELQDTVEFLGVTDHVQDYIQAMDVFLMPSLFEGLSIVALEVQGNGLPVVLSDTFAQETFVSPNTVALSLSKDATEWAEEVIQMKNKQRIDVTDLFVKRGMDFRTMMEQIRIILTQ